MDCVCRMNQSRFEIPLQQLRSSYRLQIDEVEPAAVLGGQVKDDDAYKKPKKKKKQKPVSSLCVLFMYIKCGGLPRFSQRSSCNLN